jgi:hypothetical protein
MPPKNNADTVKKRHRGEQMFSNCPRCESYELDSCGNCQKCGYTLRTVCAGCGCKNVPLAKFCGQCGQGMTLKIRLSMLINRRFSSLYRIRFRKFAAGLTFGGLLGVFAFGSMGMRSDAVNDFNNKASMPVIEQSFTNNHFTSAIARLNEFRNSRDPEQPVKAGDLQALTAILLQHLRLFNSESTSFANKSAIDYLNSIKNFSRQGSLNRGSVAMLFFNLATEVLDLTYKDFPDHATYKDIPRFHFLHIPANALTELGINISRNQKEFGMQDQVTINQLFYAGHALLQATESRLKQKMFFSLQPK